MLNFLYRIGSRLPSLHFWTPDCNCRSGLVWLEKFKGKKARFSTFDFTISELTDGKEKAINDGAHTYSSLANTYLGSVEDEESEFNKLKNRMRDMVDDNFDFGQADDE